MGFQAKTRLKLSEGPARRARWDFGCSLLLHFIILSILIVSFNHSSRMAVLENSDKNEKIITARALDTPVTAPAEVPPPRPQNPRVVPVVKPEVKEDVIIVPDKRKTEAARQALIKKHLLAELRKQQKIKLRQKQLRQAALQNDFAKEMHELRLQQQMEQEAARLAAKKAAVQGEVNKYKALILQAISQHWLVPPNVNKKLSAELLIRMAPGGMVLDVQLIKSSGDETLDRSARAAVFKASPLPVPTESDAFEPFRQFVLKVKPENVLTNDSWIS